MGLDIVAYEKAGKLAGRDRKIRPDGVPDYDGDYPGDGEIVAFCYTGFERSLRGLEAGATYLLGGENFSFRAGSYGGYNSFRDDLSLAALDVVAAQVAMAPTMFYDRPFYELIFFADNEGTIGPEAAADLAEDFEAGRSTVRPKLEEWEQEKYDLFDRAFHLAAGSGLVAFG